MRTDMDRHGGERMICPRCGIEQPKQVECANCGVVVAKWKPPAARGPRLKQAGIGAVLVFLGLVVVLVAVVLNMNAKTAADQAAVVAAAAPPTTPAGLAPGQTATEHVMEDFWSSGVVGLRASSADQQDRHVAILVWFQTADCAECRAVETQLFDDPQVDAWLAQNNRVRIDPTADPENTALAEKFGAKPGSAYLIRSDGVRKPIEVFQKGTTTPRAAAEWLTEARKLAGR